MRPQRFDAEAVRIAPTLLIAFKGLVSRNATPADTVDTILRYAHRLCADISMVDMRPSLSTLGTLIHDVVEAATCQIDVVPTLNAGVLHELILEALTTGGDQPASDT